MYQRARTVLRHRHAGNLALVLAVLALVLGPVIALRVDNAASNRIAENRTLIAAEEAELVRLNTEAIDRLERLNSEGTGYAQEMLSGVAERLHRIEQRLDALEARQRAVRAQSASTTRTTAARTSTANVAASGDVWHRLAMCETGGKMDNPNTGNGYYGYFQFDLSTWRSVGGPGYPHEQPYETQRHYAQVLQSRRGWSPWPTCARKLGLL